MLPTLNAIAEPRRREFIDILFGGQERAVGDIIEALRMPQPAVSKHLFAKLASFRCSLVFLGGRSSMSANVTRRG
jgi:DNA-binding transcriptional ArsR family regulator